MFNVGNTACSGRVPCRNGEYYGEGGRGGGKWCRFIIQAQFSSCYLSSCEFLKTIGMHVNLNKRNKQESRLGHCHHQDTMY